MISPDHVRTNGESTVLQWSIEVRTVGTMQVTKILAREWV